MAHSSSPATPLPRPRQPRTTHMHTLTLYRLALRAERQTPPGPDEKGGWKDGKMYRDRQWGDESQAGPDQGSKGPVPHPIVPSTLPSYLALPVMPGPHGPQDSAPAVPGSGQAAPARPLPGAAVSSRLHRASLASGGSSTLRTPAGSLRGQRPPSVCSWHWWGPLGVPAALVLEGGSWELDWLLGPPPPTRRGQPLSPGLGPLACLINKADKI